MTHVRVSQESQTGLTKTEIRFTYEVLEALREKFEHEGLDYESQIMNEAHCLIQEFQSNSDFVDYHIV
jgi:hypothetical protein